MLIENRITISSPVDRVWATTIDIDRWPDWAPTVEFARRLDHGLFGVGSRATIKQPMQPSGIWQVVEFEDGRRFVWEKGRKLFRMRASHRVRPHAKGAESKLDIKLTGPLATIFAPIFWFPLKMALWQENRGLKKWCEAHE